MEEQASVEQGSEVGDCHRREGLEERRGRNAQNDRPIEEPNQIRNLGLMGEWETIPSGRHSGQRGTMKGGDVACRQGHQEN